MVEKAVFTVRVFLGSSSLFLIVFHGLESTLLIGENLMSFEIYLAVVQYGVLRKTRISRIFLTFKTGQLSW